MEQGVQFRARNAQFGSRAVGSDFEERPNGEAIDYFVSGENSSAAITLRDHIAVKTEPVYDAMVKSLPLFGQL